MTTSSNGLEESSLQPDPHHSHTQNQDQINNVITTSLSSKQLQSSSTYPPTIITNIPEVTPIPKPNDDDKAWMGFFAEIKHKRLGDVIVLSIAFLLIFMAFSVVQNLASTVLPPSVAFPALGTIYGAFGLFNLTSAASIVERIGCRAGLFLSSLTYTILDVAYVIAIMHDGDPMIQSAILIPASVLIGFGASILWSAQGAYLTRSTTKESLGKYSGIFFGIMGLSYVLGPLLTSLLLTLDVDKAKVFEILAAVGFGGPLTLIYIWIRPEPVSPDINTESEASNNDVVDGGGGNDRVVIDEGQEEGGNAQVESKGGKPAGKQFSSIFSTAKMMVTRDMILLT
ncbi:hypothetical protein HDU76_008230, partial [Blyttiomyces sp. JEL0837]